MTSHVIQRELLAWGVMNQRDLPWRQTRDPWAILVSEIMLQQTQVDRVVPKFEAFMDRFPDTATCALAAAGDVIAMWNGLGYNRRAVMLHRAATQVEQTHDGAFPATLSEVQALPGVGPYTARALMAFAFEADAAPVDTNIGRILARLTGRTLSTGDAQQQADDLMPPGQAWEWNQMLMDFGATLCTRRSPRCDICPVRNGCRWAGRGPDPADRSAGVSGVQSKFAGSDRQGRGRLIKALSAAPVASADLAEVMGWPHDRARAQRVCETLIADGLAEASGTYFRLPGRP